MNVLLNNIAVRFINYGSVGISLQVSTNNAPGSQGAVDQQNSLNNLLSSNNGVAGMSVSSSSVTTNGGSNSDSSGGLSNTTIIILAVCIPVGFVCNFLLI